MSEVVTVTLNPAIDQSTSVDRVVPEDKLRCAPPSFEPGGGGLNVARVLARLGRKPRALWTSAGTAGTQLSGLLDDAGLDHEAIPVSGLTRTNVVVYEDSSTHQFRFGMPGPRLTAADLQVVLERFARLEPAPKLVVLSGSLPPGAPEDLYAQIVRGLAAGTKVVLDTSGPALRAGLGAGAFLVKPNLRELSQWADAPLEDDEHIVAAARRLLSVGPAERVVVSLGAAGALAVDAGGAWVARAPTVPIRSKVGAGDSMVGGLVSAMLEGADFPDVARRGVAAGAAAVTTPGSELCLAEDVWRLEGQTRVSAL